MASNKILKTSGLYDKSMGDRDDLEYNLTFPTGLFSDEPEPVVFLLGWVGSKDKHIAKYSSIYENEGCITIRYIHPHKKVFMTDPNDSLEHQSVSVKLTQLLEDYDLLRNPVFVHVFSNGGFFVYQHLADVFSEKHVNVAGAIFDSCPSQLHCAVGVKAILHSRAFANRILTYMVAIAFSFFYVFLYIKSLFGFGKRSDVFAKMKQSKIHMWPNLYLYSTADVIVPSKQIEEMANARREIGVPFVQQHNFGTSPHVMHLKLFPDTYKSECVNFLNKCLGLVRKDRGET